MNEREMDGRGNGQDRGAADEIKSALDREVAHRFEGDRVMADHARALARSRTDQRGRDEWRRVLAATGASGASGPFARVPVPLQWLGLAAAIVAAATGIRSVYRDWTAPAASPVAARAAATPDAAPPENLLDAEEMAKPAGDRSASLRPATPPGPPRAEEDRGRPDEAVSEAGDEAEDEDGARVASAIDTAPSAPSPRPVAKSARGLRLGSPASSVIGGIGASAPNGSESERHADATPAPTGQPLPTAVLLPGVLAPGAGEVRIAANHLLRQGLLSEIRVAPELQATLVTIRGIRGRARPIDGASPPEPDAFARPGRGASPHAPGGRPGVTGRGEGAGSRHERRRSERQTVAQSRERASSNRRDPATGAGERPGVYYARAFVGSAFNLPAHDEQGYMGQGADAIPLRSHETWGTSRHEEALRRAFDLRSVVAIDGAWVPDGAGGAAGGEATLIVSAAGKVYEIGLKGDLSEGSPTEHAVLVRLARKFIPGTGPSGAREIEIPIVVGNGGVAVLCVPDPLLGGEHSGDAPLAQNMVFIALSPRFDDLAPAPLIEVPGGGGRWNDSAVVADRVEPRYPEDARMFGIQGDVVVGATVLRNGAVDGVHVVSIPEVGGAETLIEAASSAVRRWRFLPARDHGEPIDSLVTVTIGFRLGRRQE